ncbi:MAG: metal ABC transporter permease [Candidatus Aminicenantales bacterium]
MTELLSYGFLQRALLAGIFIGLACAVLGVFLLLRKDAMIGHGLSHVAFAGVALGLFLQMMPLLMALIISVVAALGIMKLKVSAGLYGDTAIAILSSAGMGTGILLATLSHNFNAALLNYLFGDVLTIAPLEVWLSIGLAILVLLLVLGNYHKFMYMTFDRESAQASGIKVNRMETFLSVLTAVTIVLGMKIVGILLVSALVVIPAAASLQVARNFKKAVLLSCGFAFFSVIFGLWMAFTFDLPASGTIVILSFFVFGICFFAKKRF